MTGKVVECLEHFTDKQVHWSQVIELGYAIRYERNILEKAQSLTSKDGLGLTLKRAIVQLI